MLTKLSEATELGKRFVQEGAPLGSQSLGCVGGGGGVTGTGSLKREGFGVQRLSPIRLLELWACRGGGEVEAFGRDARESHTKPSGPEPRSRS